MDSILKPNFSEYESYNEDKDNLSLSTINGMQCSEQLDELYSQQERALEKIRALYTEIIGTCPTTKQLSNISRNVNKNPLLIANNERSLEELGNTGFSDSESQSCALIINNNLEFNDRFLGVWEKSENLHSNSSHLHLSKPDITYVTTTQNEKDKKQYFNDKVLKTTRVSKGDDIKSLPNTNRGKGNEKIHALPLNITVPEPFKMTLREIQERDKRELKRKQLTEKWQKSLKEELNVKIHANPVPAHVHLPLYQAMMENYERRKKERKKESIERAKSIIKPFHFSLKQEITLKKTSSVPNLSVENSSEVKHFRAKPVPREVLDGKIRQKLIAEEEQRKIRISQRAEKMLQSSSLPFSGRSILRKFSSLTNLSDDVNIKDPQKNSNSKSKNHLSQSTLTKYKENLNNWEARVTTVCQPFNLSESRRSSAKEVENKTNQTDSIYHSTSYSSLPGTKQMHRNSYNASSSVPVSPCSVSPEASVKMTVTALLRNHQVRKKIEEKENMIQEEKREKEGRAKREIELQKAFIPKFQANDPTLYKKYSTEDKVKSYREARLMRQMEYEQELKEIQDRVERKPLLVERQTMNAAKHHIERQFEEKLKEAGLDMDFVQNQSEKFLCSVANSNLSNDNSSHGRRSGSSGSSRTQCSEEYASDNSSHSHYTQSSCDLSS